MTRVSIRSSRWRVYFMTHRLKNGRRLNGARASVKCQLEDMVAPMFLNFTGETCLTGDLINVPLGVFGIKPGGKGRPSPITQMLLTYHKYMFRTVFGM